MTEIEPLLTEYLSDPDRTFLASSFLVWIHRTYPDVLDQYGHEALNQYVHDRLVTVVEAARGMAQA
ncbi:MAG: hypothetical protein AAF493_03695 [Pseudomonadota bacterium]